MTVDAATNRVSGWSYDAAGNVTNDLRNTYAYDAENRVISMTVVGGGTTTYGYDAFGSRVQKVSGGTTVRYYFGLGENTNGSWTKFFIGTPAGVVEWSSDVNGIIFKSNDHLGSPRVMTGSAGTVTARTDLYPYGEVWSETGGGTKYKMTGKERDNESGNDFFGARYYANVNGRWLSPDPAFGNIFDPPRLNRYRYCLNDPINYIDRDGADEEPYQTGYTVHGYGYGHSGSGISEPEDPESIHGGGGGITIKREEKGLFEEGSRSGAKGKPFSGPFLDHPELLKDAYCLWKGSGFGSNPTERSSWLEKNQNGDYFLDEWPYSATAGSETWNGPIPQDQLGIVHTHLDSMSPLPSSGDAAAAKQIGAPVYVVTRKGIWQVNSAGIVSQVANEHWWEDFDKNNTQCPK